MIISGNVFTANAGGNSCRNETSMFALNNGILLMDLLNFEEMSRPLN